MQKEQCVEREATIKGLVKELQQEGCYTPHLPNYDPEAAATRLRATLYETMASDSVKSYQTVVSPHSHISINTKSRWTK